MLVGERGTYRLAKPLESLQVPATVPSWRRASTACRPRRSASSDRRGHRHRGAFALVQAIEELSEEERRARPPAEPPSSSTKPASSPSSHTPSSTPSPTRWPTAVLQSGAVPCTPASSRPVNGSMPTGCPSRWNGWPACLAGRGLGQGRGVLVGRPVSALARSALREAVACFEQALTALTHLPESRATRSRPSTSGSTCGMRSHDPENSGR